MGGVRMESARRQFRKLLNDSALIAAPGAFDALSARMVEQAGFRAVYLTGGGFSRSMGFPDLGLLTMTENVALLLVCVIPWGYPLSPMPIQGMAMSLM